jgi:hypothetical protein
MIFIEVKTCLYTPLLTQTLDTDEGEEIEQAASPSM